MKKNGGRIPGFLAMMARFADTHTRGVKETYYILVSSLGLYLYAWFFNPDNKMMLVACMLLAIVLYARIRDIRMTLIIMFILTSIFEIGKSYQIPIVDLRSLPQLQEKFPYGYLYRTVTLSISEIFAGMLGIVFLRDTVGKIRDVIRSITLADVLVASYFLVRIGTDIFISARPAYSLFIEKTFIECVLVYFSIRLFVVDKKRLFQAIVYAYIAIVFFETFITLQQVIAMSPLGKNVESLHGIDQFGGAQDEFYFVFRPIGTMSYTNSFGFFMTLFIPLFVGLYAITKKRMFAWTAFAALVTVVLTLSRNAWLALFIGSLFLLHYLEHERNISLLSHVSTKTWMIAGAILILVGFYALPRILQSGNLVYGGGLELRMEQAQEVMEAAKTHPLGVGADMALATLTEANPKGVYGRDTGTVLNVYLSMLMEYGLLLVGIHLAMLWMFFRDLARQRSIMSRVIMSVFIAIVVGGLFQNLFSYLFFFIWGGFDSETWSQVDATSHEI